MNEPVHCLRLSFSGVNLIAVKESRRKVQHATLRPDLPKESAMIFRPLLFLFFIASLLPVSQNLAQSVSTAMINVPYKGKDYIGQPLAWDGKDVVLLRRDGRISRLPATDLNSMDVVKEQYVPCLLYTSPSPRDQRGSRMPSSA